VEEVESILKDGVGSLQSMYENWCKILEWVYTKKKDCHGIIKWIENDSF
jgi:hypothetical protein